MYEHSKTLKSTFEMVLEINCWMVNHFKQTHHAFLVDEKFVLGQISSNTIQHDFFLLL